MITIRLRCSTVCFMVCLAPVTSGGDGLPAAGWLHLVSARSHDRPGRQAGQSLGGRIRAAVVAVSSPASRPSAWISWRARADPSPIRDWMVGMAGTDFHTGQRSAMGRAVRMPGTDEQYRTVPIRHETNLSSDGRLAGGWFADRRTARRASQFPSFLLFSGRALFRKPLLAPAGPDPLKGRSACRDAAPEFSAR